MTAVHQHWPVLLSHRTDLRDRLVEAYDRPQRGYHNVEHLQEMFGRIDAILRATEDALGSHGIDHDAVLLAAWFHDAVYDAGVDNGGDNEERSARLAVQELTDAGCQTQIVDEVARLVRLTSTHQVAADDLAGQVLCDADLGILAADERRYCEYVAGVRHEHRHVSDEDFRNGRAQILRKLLDAPTLYCTSFARQHWESAARANIERELHQHDGA